MGLSGKKYIFVIVRSSVWFNRRESVESPSCRLGTIIKALVYWGPPVCQVGCSRRLTAQVGAHGHPHFVNKGPETWRGEVKSLLVPGKCQNPVCTQFRLALEAELGTTRLSFGQAAPLRPPSWPTLWRWPRRALGCQALGVPVRLCSPGITTSGEGMSRKEQSRGAGTTLPPSVLAEGPRMRVSVGLHP